MAARKPKGPDAATRQSANARGAWSVGAPKKPLRAEMSQEHAISCNLFKTKSELELAGESNNHCNCGADLPSPSAAPPPKHTKECDETWRRMTLRPGDRMLCVCAGAPLERSDPPRPSLHDGVIPMRLVCEACGRLHIDEGEWATRPHHTHTCQYEDCGLTWRPAIVHTVGVRFLPGFRSEAAAEPHSAGDGASAADR